MSGPSPRRGRIRPARREGPAATDLRVVVPVYVAARRLIRSLTVGLPTATTGAASARVPRAQAPCRPWIRTVTEPATKGDAGMWGGGWDDAGVHVADDRRGHAPDEYGHDARPDDGAPVHGRVANAGRAGMRSVSSSVDGDERALEAQRPDALRSKVADSRLRRTRRRGLELELRPVRSSFPPTT